ncbi:MAG: TonB-dependent receptor family protein, partial [Chitinophagaceae bacterium]|nr:TonB-dependent receptor family protein [Chitinophagaceae bacterium]
PAVDFGLINIGSDFKTLKEVIVTSEVPVQINGDTLAFKAHAFKTKPNATVEDLLKKMPGMTVDKDGTVRAQGENVQKVYVDGKEFFNNDPKLATKNLTADMVDQVEVFDDMSEQAKFNRIDDGSRTKAINLKLKKEKKKGIFGKAYAGYGNEEHYDAGITANFFKGASQASVIAKANNVNNIGFTIPDMIGMFGPGGKMNGMDLSKSDGRSGMQILPMSGGNFSGFNVGSTGGSGLTTSSSAGFNYRDTWSNHFDFNGSYFFNQANAENLRTSYRQIFLSSDTTQINDQQSASQNTNNNNRLNFNLIYTIDSLNSLIYSPNINFQNSETMSDDTTAFFVDAFSSLTEINESRTVNNSKGEGLNWNNNLIWRKKFSRVGRTFSVNLLNTTTDNERNSFYRINSKFRNSNYKNDVENETRNYGATLSLTEPVGRDKILEFNYSYNKNKNVQNRETFNFNNSSGEYDLLNDSLTNRFENITQLHRVGSNFRISRKKYNFQIGVSVQHTDRENNNFTKNENFSDKYTNIVPNASINYQFAKSRNLRFTYRSRTRLPTVNQLQDVVDVSRFPYISRGNPGLKQEFTNNFSLNYTFFDLIRFRNVFALLSFSNTGNKIANSTKNLGTGVQETMPVNIDGAFNAIGNFNIGFPIKKMKSGTFNTGTHIQYNRDVNLVDSEKNYIRSLTLGEDLRMNYSYKERLDLGITAGVYYTSAQYSIQKNYNASYYTQNYSADITYMLPKSFLLSTDLDFNVNTGKTDAFDQNFFMWNASFAKQMLKNKRGELKLSIFDILDQNKSITRNVAENYVEDVQNKVLNRFFMMTFTYNINRMGGNMPGTFNRTTRDTRKKH